MTAAMPSPGQPPVINLSRTAMPLVVPIFAATAAGIAADTAALSPEVVGGKAAGLMRMAGAGLPVPPGFVLTTEVGRRYLRDGEPALAAVMPEVEALLARLERQSHRGFGAIRHPLLVSVRSGAACSMPGMLETILNIGLNEVSLEGLIRETGDTRFAWDCYRRLVQQFAEVVHGCPASAFAVVVDEHVSAAGETEIEALDFAQLERLTEALKHRYRALIGAPFPQEPMAQLRQAIGAVFASWRSDKARTFRQLNGLDEEAGTAATVQAMVYGNRGALSGAGVGFTRDPDSGAKRLFLDFRFGGQGEDVVSGRVRVTGAGDFAKTLPAVAAALTSVARRLEAEFGDMQDFEFTVEEGALFLLQARNGLRAPLAALIIAVDMVDEGLIDETTAVKRLACLDLGSLGRRRLRIEADVPPLARATAASAGVAVGRVCFDAASVAATAARGEAAILVQHDLATSEIAAIAAAEGTLTCVGARTAHAAVVARQMGKVCLVGCRTLTLVPERGLCRLGDCDVAAGEMLTLDGDHGAVYLGARPIDYERPEVYLERVRRWRATAAPQPAKIDS